jgi:hypothetical protein
VPRSQDLRPYGYRTGRHGRESRRRRWAWVGGLKTYDHRHSTRAAAYGPAPARLLPHPAPPSLVDDHVVLAAPNKCLAQSNKSRPPSKATKRQNAMKSTDRAVHGWSGRKQSECRASCTDEPAIEE